MFARRPVVLAIVLAFAVAVAVAACGGSSSTPAASASGPAGTASAGTATPGASQVSASGAATMLPAGGGSCNVAVTGDLTVSWQSPQDAGSLLVSYWLSSADRTLAGMTDGETFILNCQSDANSASFTMSTGTTAAMFPRAPGTYVLAASGITGSDKAGQVDAILDFSDSAVWQVSEPGTFQITNFGGNRLTGTFRAKLEKLGDDLHTVAGTATLTGTFDLACTGSACS